MEKLVKRLSKAEVLELLDKEHDHNFIVLDYHVCNTERQLRTLPDKILCRIFSRLMTYRKKYNMPTDMTKLYYSDDWKNDRLQRHQIEKIIYCILDYMSLEYHKIIIQDERVVHLYHR